MNVLIACEESQRVCTAFREKGHDAFSCDIQECSGGRPEWHIMSDVLPLINGRCSFYTMDGICHEILEKWDLIIAHPPCTHLCNSGARWFTEGRKPQYLRDDALSFLLAIASADCDKICIENPVGYPCSHYRKPDQIIEPWMFGDPENKKTCLWLKGLPKLEKTNVIPKDQRKSSIWKAEFDGKKYSWNDPIVAKLRSRTFPGIARAMSDAWG